jgi:hypothetical protein
VRKQILKTLVLGTLALSAALMTGCFGSNESGPQEDATLSLSMGLKDVNKDGNLRKGATITYTKLLVTLVSNGTVRDTIRDTITPGENGFTSNAMDSQVVTKTYNVKPLRSWHVTVKTIDQNDSIIHSDTGSAVNVLIGQTRTITLNLKARFVMYVAKFTLPDSLRTVGGLFAQKLNVTRFLMVVDGDTVADSSKIYFAAGAPGHVLQFDYIKADEDHSVELYVFGDVSGSTWPSNKPLFGDTIAVTPAVDSLKPTLPWIGPGSKNDPDYDPTAPGGAKIGLTINIGKVGILPIDASLQDTLEFSKRRSR